MRRVVSLLFVGKMVPGSRSSVPGRRTASGWLGVKRHCHGNGLPEAGGCRKARSGGSHGAADQWHWHPGDSHEDTKARSLEESAQSLGVFVASCESCIFSPGRNFTEQTGLVFRDLCPEAADFQCFSGHRPPAECDLPERPAIWSVHWRRDAERTSSCPVCQRACPAFGDRAAGSIGDGGWCRTAVFGR